MRREPMALAALAIATFVAYAWSAHFWIDPVDEGYFLDLADRVTRGELPYRDFTTYYTPGIFYLFAATFKLFGPSLLWPRYLMAALRAATLLLTYGLTRRVAPWPFALLPFAVTALLDHWPLEPEPHPSWPAIVLCLATVECATRHLQSGRLRWLALAGLSTAACVAFKQNIGAFTALALAGYIILRPRAASSSALKAIQAVFVLAVAFAVTFFLWPMMDARLAFALWIPLLAALALAARPALSVPARDRTDGLQPLLIEATAAGAAFVTLTLAWLLPLAAALGAGNVPFALFFGAAVDSASIATRFADVTSAARPLLLFAIWIPALLVRGKSLLVAVALTALLPLLPVSDVQRDPITTDGDLLNAFGWLDQDFGTLHLYLPALAAWAGIAMLGLTLRKPRAATAFYLLFGTLAALTIYPRSDTLHALVGAPPILVAGAAALGQVYCTLRRPLLVGALLVLPVVAIAPQVAWRAANIISPEKGTPRFSYSSLAMSRAPVLIPARWSDDVRHLIEYIRANTPPGEAFFAYPVDPIFNFLTDRPNPTRFDHFIPHTLTEADLESVVADLQRAQPRYVLWNHYNVLVWETDPANRVLSDYLWGCYQQVATFDLYLVLERKAATC